MFSDIGNINSEQISLVKIFFAKEYNSLADWKIKQDRNEMQK